jgi:hypothetical protein
MRSLIRAVATVATVAAVAAAPGCEAKAPARATAPLVDLTTTSTLAPVRAAFNAHRGEARFLTLLSPT